MSRVDILRSMLNLDAFGLEIGPSYNPLMPKSARFHVEIFDYADQPTLIEKYRNFAGFDWRVIEEVDYVSDGRRMCEVIGATKKYNYIIASHVIEHVPDVIGFLQDWEALLKDDGVMVQAVPDKRFCFDVLRPVSTVGAIIQAHLEKRTRHPAGTMFDYLFMMASREGNIVWAHESTSQINIRLPLTLAQQTLQEVINDSTYLDAHAWQDTPSSFRLAMKMLHILGYVSLKEARFEVDGSCEFFVSLSSQGGGCPVEYSELLIGTLHELRAVNL